MFIHFKIVIFFYLFLIFMNDQAIHDFISDKLNICFFMIEIFVFILFISKIINLCFYIKNTNLPIYNYYPKYYI